MRISPGKDEIGTKKSAKEPDKKISGNENQHIRVFFCKKHNRKTRATTILLSFPTDLQSIFRSLPHDDSNLTQSGRFSLFATKNDLEIFSIFPLEGETGVCG